MTEALERAFEAVRQLPEARQNEIAEVIVSLTAGDPNLALDQLESPELLAELQHALEAAKRGEFASDAEIETIFAEAHE